MAAESDLVGDIFGWVGTAITIYLYFAPCVPFIKVVKEELKYSDSPGLLLIFSGINSFLWIVYGLLQDSIQLYISSGIGGAATVVWITIFLIYFAEKKILLAILLIFVLTCCVVGIPVIFFYFVGAYITGLTAMIFNILMYAAPGEKIYRVITTGNYELIPVFSTAGVFLSSVCWLAFGIYQKDINLIIPNVLGLLFAILQIVIYLIYYYKAKKENKDLKEVSDEVA